MLGRVAGRALAYAVWSAAVAVVVVELGIGVGVGPLAHSLLGVALGMLLVFRTNASYDRYWEGRRRWSEIVAASRSLIRGWVSYAKRPDPGFVMLVAAYAGAVANRLRGPSASPVSRPTLSPDDACALDGATQDPVALSWRMTHRLQASVDAGDLHPTLAAQLETYVAALTEHESACIRIANSPMPRAYVVQIRQLLTVYLATLPFALVEQLGWLSAPATFVIAFGLSGIETAGTAIEDPFGDDADDLPLLEYCATVRSEGKLIATRARAA